MSFAADALAEFHEFYGRDDPVLSPRLRLRLINEEHEELVDEVRAAYTVGLEWNKAKMYKELADLVYVCYGLDLHMGGYLDRALEEVHRSNMTKLWDCEHCATWTHSPERTRICPECHGEGKVVKRREDGKILKPPTYTPPDLSFIE